MTPTYSLCKYTKNMFNRKKKQQRIMEAVNMIKPTSKAALKSQCLYLSGLDVAKAEKMYDFLVKDMDGLPSVEPTSKPFMDNVKEQANGIFGWLRENEDVLTKGAEFFKNIFQKKAPASPAQPLPQINK